MAAQAEKPGNSAEEQSYLFHDDGAVYRVRFEGEEGSIGKLRGASYIYKLLQHPHQPFSAFDLHVGDREVDEGLLKRRKLRHDSVVKPFAEDGDEGAVGPQRDTGWTDQQANQAALRDYYDRLEEIKAEKEQAADDKNDAAYGRLEKEEDAIRAEVKRLRGKFGRARLVDPQYEQARSSVAKAIGRVIDRCRKDRQLSKLADHLHAYIEVGRSCAYRPPKPCPVWHF